MPWPSILIEGSREEIDSRLKELITGEGWLVGRQKLLAVDDPYWVFNRDVRDHSDACYFLHEQNGLKLVNCIIHDRNIDLPDKKKKAEDQDVLEALITEVLSTAFEGSNVTITRINWN